MAKAKPVTKAELKKVETSAKDEKRDAEQSYPEGSAKDIASDKKQAVRDRKKAPAKKSARGGKK